MSRFRLALRDFDPTNVSFILFELTYPVESHTLTRPGDRQAGFLKNSVSTAQSCTRPVIMES
jgi:hypothetical protein